MSDMAKRYIGDWHYDHANILHYDNRPFTSVYEMNDALVVNWNHVTAPGDTVDIVGDMFWGGPAQALPVLKELNGQKILIRGNHDHFLNSETKKCFDGIYELHKVKDGDRHVVLCHFPMSSFENMFQGWYHLYAHVHTSFEANIAENNRRLMEDLYMRPCNAINVGAMMPYIGYAPRTLDEIIEGYEYCKNSKFLIPTKEGKHHG